MSTEASGNAAHSRAQIGQPAEPGSIEAQKSKNSKTSKVGGARPPPPVRRKRSEEAPPRPASFSLIKRGKSPKTPTREFMRALATALPGSAGMGSYWRDEILAAREAWPPPKTMTPPAECRRRGDRGRIYPAYYVRHDERNVSVERSAEQLEAGDAPDRARRFLGAVSIACKPQASKRRKRRLFATCQDCWNEVWLKDRIDFAIFCGEFDTEARDAGVPPVAAVDPLDGGDRSPSGEMMEALRATGAELIERKIAPEGELALLIEIARHDLYEAARACTIREIKPFAKNEEEKHGES